MLREQVIYCLSQQNGSRNARLLGELDQQSELLRVEIDGVSRALRFAHDANYCELATAGGQSAFLRKCAIRGGAERATARATFPVLRHATQKTPCV